jgi:hypothetical protein
MDEDADWLRHSPARRLGPCGLGRRRHRIACLAGAGRGGGRQFRVQGKFRDATAWETISDCSTALPGANTEAGANVRRLVLVFRDPRQGKLMHVNARIEVRALTAQLWRGMAGSSPVEPGHDVKVRAGSLTERSRSRSRDYGPSGRRTGS